MQLCYGAKKTASDVFFWTAKMGHYACNTPVVHKMETKHCLWKRRECSDIFLYIFTLFYGYWLLKDTFDLKIFSEPAQAPVNLNSDAYRSALPWPAELLRNFRRCLVLKIMQAQRILIILREKIQAVAYFLSLHCLDHLLFWPFCIRLTY